MLKDKLSVFKKRVVRKCYPFFVFPLFIFFTPYSIATEILSAKIQEIQVIAKSGAVSLALQSIDEQQKTIDIQSNPANLIAWIEWERERLSIYQQGQRWQALHQRIAAYDKALPDDFYFFAKQQQIDALLKLKQGQQARQILQDLIWTQEVSSETGTEQQKKWLAVWQKRIIKSYLVENETSDALLAAQRYYQDYGHDTLDDRLLRARILLMNQREDEVVELLANDTKHPHGGMLYLLAQLRSGARPSQKVWQAARRQMRGKWASEELRYMLWAVAAEAARHSGDRPSTVNALEFVLAGNKKTELPSGLFDFTSDTLWNAYIDFALHFGNRAQFLIGNDQQWLNAAIKVQKQEPVKARSLFALVMIKGQNDESRLRAAKGFLSLMHKRKRGAELVIKLFLNSGYFKTLNTIPEPVRYDLVNIALSRSNIELASNLMATIKIAPADADSFQWQLRRARIFVLGGKSEKGSDSLKFILEKNKTLTREQIDQFLQVVFDLQTVKKHELAYQLFNAVLPKLSDVMLQREIYYWMADSRKALNDYPAAARLYLRSALHAENNGLDPWGQTARYQVAEMLVKADLFDDAHSIYQQLLDGTKEPARRAVLKHELQKLLLLRDPEHVQNDSLSEE
ncbi:MAG: hypothetical protein OQK75_00890 [Gammaproteobacteria bacterium]|nr:hypothetical protein [Gammaproteobacteria bacterium]MCW8986201.1 hypothetical protein [Gammaproteobacteria bacterium]MCW9031957.1 hypothetical protein [Gammaproteobacteria bacterium]